MGREGAVAVFTGSSMGREGAVAVFTGSELLTATGD